MTGHTLPCVVVCALLVACGAGEASPTTDPAEHPETDEAEAPEPAAEAPPGETDEARAIRLAEAFVRAQGYTDAPPTVSGDGIVHEGIEGSMEDRRDTLQPRALRASGEGDEWMVVFAYVNPEYAGRGRALRLVEGQRPQFVHQDMLLSPAE